MSRLSFHETIYDTVNGERTLVKSWEQAISISCQGTQGQWTEMGKLFETFI